jgi:hypothetical protein
MLPCVLRARVCAGIRRADMWTQTERSTEYVLFLKTLLERMKTVGLGSDLLHGCADLSRFDEIAEMASAPMSRSSRSTSRRNSKELLGPVPPPSGSATSSARPSRRNPKELLGPVPPPSGSATSSARLSRRNSRELLGATHAPINASTDASTAASPGASSDASTNASADASTHASANTFTEASTSASALSSACTTRRPSRTGSREGLHDSSDEPFIYPLFASLLPHDADALAAKEQALHHAPPANGRRSRRPSCEISRAHSDITGCREVHAPPIERSASMPAECTAVS